MTLVAYCDVCGTPDAIVNADVRMYRKHGQGGQEWMLDLCDVCAPKFQERIPGTPRQDNTPSIILGMGSLEREDGSDA